MFGKAKNVNTLSTQELEHRRYTLSLELRRKSRLQTLPVLALLSLLFLTVLQDVILYGKIWQFCMRLFGREQLALKFPLVSRIASTPGAQIVILIVSNVILPFLACFLLCYIFRPDEKLIFGKASLPLIFCCLIFGAALALFFLNLNYLLPDMPQLFSLKMPPLSFLPLQNQIWLFLLNLIIQIVLPLMFISLLTLAFTAIFYVPWQQSLINSAYTVLTSLLMALFLAKGNGLIFYLFLSLTGIYIYLKLQDFSATLALIIGFRGALLYEAIFNRLFVMQGHISSGGLFASEISNAISLAAQIAVIFFCAAFINVKKITLATNVQLITTSNDYRRDLINYQRSLRPRVVRIYFSLLMILLLLKIIAVI